VENINQEVYIQMARAAAHTLDELANKEDLRGFLNE
jgi:hypothetical protein